MTANPEPVQSFVVDVWRACLEQVLRSIPGGAAEVSLAASTDRSAKPPSDPEAWLCFSADNGWQGEVAFSVPLADAVRLAQLFMGEPANSGAEFGGDYRDALAELFRQVQGAAAVELKAKLGKAVALVFRGQQEPAWPAAMRLEFQARLESGNPLLIRLLMNDALIRALGAMLVVPATPSGSVAGPAPRSRADNLELFLDIELEATLRFGERDLFLRDVLDLHSGAVVELDHRVSDPVELLVGGRVIAKGEVVVMDGNYALRVTEVLSASERMASLPTKIQVP